MIRRLSGSEGSEPSRVAPYFEPTDQGSDRELAEEFREFLEKARTRVSRAGEEVSALSVALAQTQPMAQPQPKPMQEPSLKGAELQDHEGSGWEDLAQGGGGSSTTGRYTADDSTRLSSKAEFEGKEQLERGACHTEEASTPALNEHDHDGVVTAVSVDQMYSTMGEGEESAVTADTSQELLPNVAGASDTFAEITEHKHSEVEQGEVAPPPALEVEEATLASSPQVNHERVTGIQRVDNNILDAGDRTQAKPDFVPQSSAAVPATSAGRAEVSEVALSLREGLLSAQEQAPLSNPEGKVPQDMSRFSTELMRQTLSSPNPRDVSLNRGGDASIQMALLRQAFESVKGFGAGQLQQEAKPTTSPSQAVGVASGSARAQGDLQSKALKPMTKVQVHRMLERVETALKEAARSRDGKTIRFRVEPFDLGEVKVDVSLREGLLHARLKAENQQVTNVLRDRAHELQGALRKLGLEVDSVTVTVSDEAEVDLGTGQQGSAGGKTFQEERNNMPGEMAQVVDNTIGNELAQVSSADPVRMTDAILDHWVA